MKPEMHDVEFAALELRLRRLRPARVPAAPPSLHQFIATVPATTAPRRPFALRLTGFSPLHGGALVAGVAASLVVALVVSSFVMSFRATQTSAPVAAGDWIWQKADGSVLGQIDAVAHGYVANCQPGGAAAPAPSDPFDQLQQQFNGADAGSLCTSSDGLTWTTPPDPRILDIPAGSTFEPGAQAQLGEVGLIASITTDTVGNSITALWRSTDGVRWTEVDDPRLGNLMVMSLGVIGGRFVAVAEDVSTHTGWLIASPDGLTWERATQLSGEPGSSAIGAGLIIFTPAGQPTQMSRDGSTWHQLQLPDGVTYLGGVTRLPDGEYVAAGLGTQDPAQHILRSVDGVTWRLDDGSMPGAIVGVAWFDGRAVASVLEGVMPEQIASAALSDIRLWQSLDGGHTWSRLNGPDGKQMAGLGMHVGDVLGVVVPDAQNRRHLAWIGKPAKTLATATEPPSTPAASTGPTAPINMLTPAIETLAPGQTPDTRCDQNPSWMPVTPTSILDRTGWYDVATFFGGGQSPDAYSCGYQPNAEAGNELAILGYCEGAQTLHLSIMVSSPSSPPRQFGELSVVCVKTQENQLVFWTRDDGSDLRGMHVQINVFVGAEGNYAFRAVSRPPSTSAGPAGTEVPTAVLPSKSPTTRPTFAATSCPGSSAAVEPSWLPVVPASDLEAGWTHVAAGWYGNGFGCNENLAVSKSALALLVSCDSPAGFRAELRDLTVDSVLGSYTVTCPRHPADPTPVVVYAGAPVGHAIGVVATTEVTGNWGYRIMTADVAIWGLG